MSTGGEPGVSPASIRPVPATGHVRHVVAGLERLDVKARGDLAAGRTKRCGSTTNGVGPGAPIALTVASFTVPSTSIGSMTRAAPRSR